MAQNVEDCIMKTSNYIAQFELNGNISLVIVDKIEA